MRYALVIAALVGAGGCSLLFDGKDLHGKGGGGADLGAGGDGGGGDLGGGGGDLGGGGPSCTPLATVKFTVSKPSVASTGPYEIAAADIDGDGKLDLVSANYGGNDFSVLLGDGQGGFALAPSTPVASCDTPQMLVTRDVTGDGLADVIVSCFDSVTPSAGVYVHVNASTPGTVKFDNAKAVALATQQGMPYIVAGKLAADAHVDLAVVDPADDLVRIYAGDGQGGFTVKATTYATGKGGSWMTAGDLNGDAVDDLLVYNETDYDMTMLLSKSDGSGFNASTLAYDAGKMSGTLSFVSNPPSLVDIDHDGRLDILVASGTSQTGTVEKFLNTGTAAAPAFPVTPVDIPTGDLPVAQGFADFNCDGTLDIAVSTNGCDPANAPPSCPGDAYQPPNLWILPGHGAGYDPALATQIPVGTYNVVIADFNGDGYPDVATGSAASAITVLIDTP